VQPSPFAVGHSRGVRPVSGAPLLRPSCAYRRGRPTRRVWALRPLAGWVVDLVGIAVTHDFFTCQQGTGPPGEGSLTTSTIVPYLVVPQLLTMCWPERAAAGRSGSWLDHAGSGPIAQVSSVQSVFGPCGGRLVPLVIFRPCVQELFPYKVLSGQLSGGL
jgi:hypothetical protein